MKDLSIAISYAELSFDELETLARQGDAEAQPPPTPRYDIDDDYKEAVKWYRKAAEQGHVESQFNLGVCYHNGDGVRKNYKKVVAWYSKAAANQNFPGAFYNLAICFEEGKGVKKDPVQAVKLYKKAAAHGVVFWTGFGLPLTMDGWW